MIFQFKLCLKQFNRRLGPHSKVSISQDGLYIAFSDIDNNILLFNRNRNTVDLLGKKSKPLKSILICQSFIAAVENQSSQLLVYSIKNCKLKKSISFSTSRITHLSYSKDRKLLLVQSRNNCIVVKLATLTKQKVLSCSTSNFVSSCFTQDGRHLVNFFDDSSVIFWNVDSYINEETSNPNISYITTGSIGLNKYIALGSDSSVYVANYIKDRTKFSKVVQVKGNVEKIYFVRNNLIIQSSYGLYIGQIHEDHKLQASIQLIAVGVKLFEACGNYLATTNLINDIIITKGGSIEFQNYEKSKLIKQIQGNLLDNTGFYCAGGFNNKQGCSCNNHSFIKNSQPKSSHYLQKMYKSILISKNDLEEFSKQKLSIFLLKRNRFVDKHRAITYQYLLDLPLNISLYKDLVRKGLNPEIKNLRLKYPIKNQSLFSTFEFVISLLSHYCPAFGYIEYVPALVFPLVLAFGEDELFCFQLSAYFLTYWMNPLFQTYPQPNVDFIYAVEQIIKFEKPALINHFHQNNLPLSHIIWFIYSTFFTQTFNRNNYMSVLDTLMCFSDTPSLIIFEIAGYILYNSKLLLSIKNQKQLFAFISKQTSQDCDKLMRLVHNLSAKYKNTLKYNFKAPFIDLKGYKRYTIKNGDAVLHQRNRKMAQQRDYLDMKRQQMFYQQQLNQQLQRKVKNRQDGNKQAIRNEIFRYRDLQFERKKFDEMNAGTKLGLIQNNALEIPRNTHQKMPYSFGDTIIGKMNNRGCCADQKFFERTRQEY